MIYIQHAINAVSLGGLFALAALGLALIFGIMRLINFAHGELIMAAAYGLLVFKIFPWPLMIILTLLLAGGLAVAMERLAFRPVRGAEPATLLMTSFFVSSFLQNSTIVAVSSTPKGVSILPGLLESVTFGDVVVQKLDLVTVGASFVLLAGIAVLLTKTLIGLQMRAASENFSMARLLRVRGNSVIAAAFVLSGVLAGTAAILLLARTGVTFPSVGLQPVLIGFVATVLGGIGSLRGAVTAGYLLGVITVALQAGLPTGLADYRDAFLFSAVLGILLWRPDGLWPTKLTGERA